MKKRLLALVLSMVMLLSFSACTGTDTQGPKPDGSTPAFVVFYFDRNNVCQVRNTDAPKICR